MKTAVWEFEFLCWWINPCQLVTDISFIVHYTLSKTFLGWNSDFDHYTGIPENRQIGRQLFVVHSLLLISCYRTMSTMTEFCIEKARNRFYRFRWSEISWCGIKKSKFLVKSSTSRRLPTVVWWTLKVFGFGLIPVRLDPGCSIWFDQLRNIFSTYSTFSYISCHLKTLYTFI